MKPLELAAYIVECCEQEKRPVSNLQLQKVLYLVQLQSIIMSPDRRTGIMSNPGFEAWRFGPVIPDVYYAYCLNGGTPIYFKPKDVRPAAGVPDFVMEVARQALKVDPWELVEYTHRPGGAWDLAIRRGYRHRISDEDIVREAESMKPLVSFND